MVNFFILLGFVSSPIQILINMQVPIVRKPISANPRLNCPNPRDKFILRLNCVPRSAISTNQGINWGLNLIHLARWINSLIGGKSSKTKQNGRLVVWWFRFNAGSGDGRKAIQATWRLFQSIFYFSFEFARSRVRFPAFFVFFFEFSQHGWTAVGRSHAQLLTQVLSKEIQPIFFLRGRIPRSLATLM